MIAHRAGKGGIDAAQESPPKREVKRYGDISNNRTSATGIQGLFARASVRHVLGYFAGRRDRTASIRSWGWPSFALL
jgi:hypothetical protein